MDKHNGKELALTLDILEKLWTEGSVSCGDLSCPPDEKARLDRLLVSIVEAQTQALMIATVDLSQEIKTAGVLTDGLRKLRERLKILAQQARKVADGDLSQRVEFMGEFASAFNEMVRSMEDTRHRLRRREADLFAMNARLHEEVEERILAQEKLEVANTTLQAQILEIQNLQAKLREQAIRDSLTCLFNRRFFEETLEKEVSIALAAGSEMTIILLDLDHFKEFNDQYGHAAGDTVLRVVGAFLQANTRTSNIACRYGGEEFIVVLPGVTLDAAFERAEKLRAAFEEIDIQYNGKALKATMSAGVSALPMHGSTGEELIRAADAALYGAKRSGRNRVVIAGSSRVEESLTFL